MHAVTFPVDSDNWRRWCNVHIYLMRHGLLLEDLDQRQRAAALDLLRASLSARGFDDVRTVMRFNEVLADITDSRDEYGEWAYFLSVFGTPSDDEPWGWQLDGHHLNLHCFVLGDQVVLTPAFLGTEPCHVSSGPHAGLRAFDAEDEQRARDGALTVSRAGPHGGPLPVDHAAPTCPPSAASRSTGR